MKCDVFKKLDYEMFLLRCIQLLFDQGAVSTNVSISLKSFNCLACNEGMGPSSHIKIPLQCIKSRSTGMDSKC
jgi:hypothetical protein